jgi:hypothetical protein
MSNHAVVDLLAAVRQFHDVIDVWHRDPPGPMQATDGISSTTLELHATNFALWHLEDAARRPDADDHDVARLKRGIDDVNARRNAVSEALDEMVLDRLGPFDDPATGLHTETPAMVVDRLSVLALRIWHARASGRSDAHLAVLDEQYDDLVDGLEDYLARLRVGRVGFKLYRQFKSAGQRDGCVAHSV